MTELDMDWPNKARARKFALGIRSRQRLLLLPGPDAHDVRAGLWSVITPASQLILVEKNRKRFEQMRHSVLNMLPPSYRRPHFHFGPLHSVDLQGSLDFAWFDFCGNLDISTMDWISQHLVHHIDEGTDLAFTFPTAERGNVLIGSLKKKIQHSMPRLSKRNCGIFSHLFCFRHLFHDWDFQLDFRTYKNKKYGLTMAVYRLFNFVREQTISVSRKEIA